MSVCYFAHQLIFRNLLLIIIIIKFAKMSVSVKQGNSVRHLILQW